MNTVGEGANAVLVGADARFLRLTFAVARRSLASGNHPFAAILVDADGAVLMEQENGYLPERDMTAHAERVLMSRASQTYDPLFLARCTMYSSAEPCAMCAGAAYWAGIGRVVYALSESRLRQLTGDHPENRPSLFRVAKRSLPASGRSRSSVRRSRTKPNKFTVGPGRVRHESLFPVRLRKSASHRYRRVAPRGAWRVCPYTRDWFPTRASIAATQRSGRTTVAAAPFSPTKGRRAPDSRFCIAGACAG